MRNSSASQSRPFRREWPTYRRFRVALWWAATPFPIRGAIERRDGRAWQCHKWSASRIHRGTGSTENNFPQDVGKGPIAVTLYQAVRFKDRFDDEGRGIRIVVHGVARIGRG